MLTFDLNQLPLQEVPGADGELSFRFDFPAYAARGTANSSVVYMEIEPGRSLGMHRDSQEEIVLVLSGLAEGTVGQDSGNLLAGQAVVIPAMVPHDFKNLGDDVLKAIGFFSGANVVSTFEPAPIPGAQAMVAFHDVNGERMMSAMDLEEPAA